MESIECPICEGEEITTMMQEVEAIIYEDLSTTILECPKCGHVIEDYDERMEE